MKILVLNAGSSSQKSCLYEITGEAVLTKPQSPVWEGKLEWTSSQGVAEMKVKTATGESLQQQLSLSTRAQVIAHLLETLYKGPTRVIDKLSDIDVVGHRVVHGGREYQESVVITEEVKQAIARLCSLAPAHNPDNLEGIEIVEQLLGQVPQVAVFDTAFHSSMPDAAGIYPGPYEWVEQGIRRYGFHGISHQYCAARVAQILDRDLTTIRLIVCHLGNGCSLAAVKNGRSVDTTMGFTPLDGLMMGSRSGAVDPGILIHLWRQGNYTAEQLDSVLNKKSGLLGISGISNDMRQIRKAIAEGNFRAQLAWDIYVHRLRFYIGAMLASLGGLDALAFTAGVGENVPEIRAAACVGFEFLGLKLDAQKNFAQPLDADIATPDSTVRVLVISTQEDWAIAAECWRLVK